MRPPLLRWSATALAIGLCAACAPSSRVVLLPQPHLATAITVTTAAGTATLDQPYAAAELGARGEIRPMNSNEGQVRERYPELLRLYPPAPQKFILEFLTGTSTLTPASQIALDTVIGAARARSGGEIVVIGHTDRQGTAADNDVLSLQRANAIRDILIGKGFKAELIDPVGRGEREPLVPTDDDVPEPRNRRAEIIVR